MAKITKSLFGTLQSGEKVFAYTLQDEKCTAKILNYGGIIQSLMVPDKDGKPTDVLLGYKDLDGYLSNGGYLCALIGRFGNRIEKGKLTLDGKTYDLFVNDRGNHLHGGKYGFNAKIWNAEEKDGKLILSYLSKDGEENYPGNLRVQVIYTLEKGALGIEYTAISDKKTAINLTNHAYFNLSGEGCGHTVHDHELTLDASYITPTDTGMIPHGELRAVQGTPFDFTAGAVIGEGDKLTSTDPDLKKGGGYDHCFVFSKQRDVKKPYGSVYSPLSGIEMKCYTDMPAVQFYAGNGLNQDGKSGHYTRLGGMCLETQAIPNNVNVPEYAAYGSSIYEKGQLYHFTAKYAFSVRK